MKHEQSKAASPAAQKLIARFEDHSASIGVIGLGYVGLPLAVVLAQAGFHVIGVDNSTEKAALLKQGRSYIEDVPDEVVSALVREGSFEATTDCRSAPQCGWCQHLCPHPST